MLFYQGAVARFPRSNSTFLCTARSSVDAEGVGFCMRRHRKAHRPLTQVPVVGLEKTAPTRW